MDYSDLKFDEYKYYLGKLCPHGHDWRGTGCSLKKALCGHCVVCTHIQQKKYKDNNRMVATICDECGSTFERKEHEFKENVRRKQSVFCSRDCKHKFFQNRVEVVCATCGVVFEKRKSHLKQSNFCSNSCKFAFYVGSKSHFYIDGRWEDYELQELKTKRRQWKWYYWKGVSELINSGKASDIVVVLAMEQMYSMIDLQLELNKLYREKKWREYITALLRAMHAHEDHLLDLIDGEVRHPQFRLRDINRSANTQLAYYREHRKEVVTNAFNHPDATPTLIEL